MPRNVFDIFLSSTSDDLKPFRNKVSETIERMRQASIRMETFGENPNTPLSVCKGKVESCDALIVIVGHRYGWIPSKRDGGDGIKSITWWEVEWAMKANKPVYAFLIDNNASWPYPREQDRLISAKNENDILSIGRAVQSLYDFRKYLETKTTRGTFLSPEDLASKVATDLHEWLLSKATAALPASVSAKAKKVASAPYAPATNVDYYKLIRWREQVHLDSARSIVNTGKKVRLAIIAGLADLSHPALANARIRHIDVRVDKKKSKPDDYTTGLATFLVGSHPNANEGLIPGVELLIIQAMNNDQSSEFEIFKALEAALIDGTQVLCMTLGSYASTEAENEFYRRASDSGMISVCASGNEPSEGVMYPAAYPECIAVTSVDDNNNLAEFAPYGKVVTTAAPGVDIPMLNSVGKYTLGSGSTYACAIVAIVVCYLLKINDKLTSLEVKRMLKETGLPVRNDPSSSVTMINALAAVLTAEQQSKVKKVSAKEKSGRNKPNSKK